jgi:micrococcal nuclease
MPRPALLLLLLGGLMAPLRAAAAQADSVWVNLRSRVYHCPGTQYYGRTVQGTYLPEPAAREQGYRPAGNRPCAPSPAPAPVQFLAMPQGADSAPGAPVRATEPCTIVRIVDGDGIACAEQGRVRLIGIDAPEPDQEPFGTAATAALAALAPVGTTVQLEPDVEALDQYRRRLAYLWLGSTQLNWVLIRQGWAVPLTFPPNVQYRDHFAAAAARARTEQRGLWAVDGFRCLPADHRRRACPD